MNSKKYFRALAAYAVIILLACSCSGAFKSQAPHVPAGQIVAPEQQWDKVFARQSGWTGADVASSFIIPGNRVLWVFGDTWVGDVQGGRHIRAVMVNNSIAISPYDPAQPGEAPAPDQMHFYWGPDDESGKPTAWVRPVQESAGTKTWYWPTGGGATMPGAEGQRLVLFLILLGKKAATDSVWGFQVMGNAVAVIDNAGEAVERWKPVIIDLPNQIKRGAIIDQVEWGSAALYEPSAKGSPGYVLIYGVESDPSGNRNLVLARVRASGFEDFKDWEFFAGNNQWLKTPGQALVIVKGVASELSVDKIADKNGGIHYVMVYSEPFLGNRIFARVALNPEGPWSEEKALFTVPDAQESKTLFAYAAKGHVPLSKPGTLLVSYIINSHDFTELANNGSIYRPLFISVPLQALGIH